MKPNLLITNILILFLLICNSFSTQAQDLIIKRDGDTILAKIIQIDTASIVFKKQSMLDGPVFIEKISAIEKIKYENGEEKIFELRETIPVITKSDIVGAPNLQYGPMDNHYQIEHIKGKQYTINTERVKLKDVDNLLARSVNPSVQIARKTAKTVRVVEKLFTYTSIATTSAGTVTSIAAINNVVKSVKAGTIRPGDYWGMGLSLFGTMAFPITSKILKNREAKLYDKAIDLYNIKN
jgi:hypothetical protein